MQDAITVELPRLLFLPRDDLAAIVSEFIYRDISRARRDRCLPSSRRLQLTLAAGPSTGEFSRRPETAPQDVQGL